MSGMTSEPGAAFKKSLMCLAIEEHPNNGFVVYYGRCESNMQRRILGALKTLEE